MRCPRAPEKPETGRCGDRGVETAQTVVAAEVDEGWDKGERECRAASGSDREARSDSEFVVVRDVQRGGLLVFGDAALEEVLFLLDVHHLGQPGQRIFHTR